jgi:hypothetical protein
MVEVFFVGDVVLPFSNMVGGFHSADRREWYSNFLNYRAISQYLYQIQICKQQYKIMDHQNNWLAKPRNKLPLY